MRLIDADRIIERNSVIMQYEGKPVRVVSVIAINNAPTIEERPTGEWRLDSIGCYCSECKKHPDVTTDYCPFCGADMKGGAE